MDAFILSAVRTPIGKFLGELADVPATRLGAVAIAEAIKRASVKAEQDRFAAQSHKRAAAAWEGGAFAAEVVPVTVGSGAKAKTVARDEGIRPESTAEVLAKLRPAFKTDGGTVTAGNASQLSDGAAAVVVASARAVEQLGAKPLARVVSYATSGGHPTDIFIAPVAAVRGVLEKAKLS